MDKVVLTSNDIQALLEWRDEHKELVRSLPEPLKAIEIDCTESGYRIRGIRKGNSLKLGVSKGYESLGNAEFEIGLGNVLIKKKGKFKFDEEGFQSILTVYCSLMALMTFADKYETQ